MLTSNILQRTYWIRYANKHGTCFTVDINGEEYLMTAAHIVSTMVAEGVVYIHHESSWKALHVQLIYRGDDEYDIVVLKPKKKNLTRLSPPHPIQVGIQNLSLAQDVFVAGFPKGLNIEIPPAEINNLFPLPVIRKGILSAFDFENSTVIIDMISVPGMSGGPVVSARNTTTPQILGIVVERHVYDAPTEFTNTETGYKDTIHHLTYLQETGFTIAHTIDKAIDAIK